MHAIIRSTWVAVSAASLGACATQGGTYSQPYALFEPEQRMPAADTRPAFIVGIDGTNVSIARYDPVRPGMRTVELSIPGPPGMSDPDRDTLIVDARPCTRYFFAARRSSMTARDWKAFVSASEPIGECAARFPAAK